MFKSHDAVGLCKYSVPLRVGCYLGMVGFANTFPSDLAFAEVYSCLQPGIFSSSEYAITKVPQTQHLALTTATDWPPSVPHSDQSVH